jgi:hypothetical protein
MNLLARLEADLRSEESYFRAQLLREDVARLKRLLELAAAEPNLDAFKREGLMIGWTPGDTRSWELKATLDPLLEAFHAAATGGGVGADADDRLLAAWQAFDAQRMERLVGCLSRIPRPRE